MELSRIATDPKMEQDGVWVNYLGDIRLKIARMGTPKYMEHLAKISKPHKSKIRTTEQDIDLIRGLTNQCLAATVLLDWENVQADSEDIVYTPEIGLKMIIDPQYHDFRQFVLQQSQDAEEYRAKSVEDSVKN